MKKMKWLAIMLMCMYVRIGYAQLSGNSLRVLADYNYVSVPDASSNLLNNTMTIEAWVYYECANGAAGNMIMSKGWCAVPDYSFYFNIVGQRLRLKKIRNGTGGCSAAGDPIWETNSDVIPFNTWVHVALSIDATTSTSALSFYVDGVLVPHTLISGVDGAGFNASPYPLLIGTSRSVSNVYSSLTGNIDEVRIWHTIRTQAEIQANKDAELSGNETGLFAYWKMNESGSGAGTTAVNSAIATGSTFNGNTVGTAANVFFINNNLVPNTLPTCDPVLWLKADAGVTYNSNSEVSAWNDQSGLNHHATMTIAANKPSYKANEINNKPVIRFDGIADYMNTTTINLSTVNKAEIFYVLKSRNEGFVLMHQNDPNAINGFSVVENYTNGTNGHSALLNGNTIDKATFKSVITDSCYHTMNIQLDKSQLGLNQLKMLRNQVALNNINGTITGAEMTNNLGNAAMYIGGTSVVGYPYLNADIAEIIVYNKILSNYERTTIHHYLNNKYFTNKVSTQFTTIPSNTSYSNEICDDDVWRHSYNVSQPQQLITSIQSACLTFDQRNDTVYVEPTVVQIAGNTFMRRHVVIQPLTEYNGTKTVRLYYTLADYNDLQNYVSSLTSHAQLSVSNYQGVDEDGVYNPLGGIITLIPASQITHGTAYGLYYLQFDVTHFGEFWIHVESVVLPISELHLNVSSNDQKHQLSWRCVDCDQVVEYSILESSDAQHFSYIRTINAETNTLQYNTQVMASNSPLQYFMVEAKDIDGHVYRSNIEQVSNKNNLYQMQVEQTPNKISITTNRIGANIAVYNTQGQKILDAHHAVVIDKQQLAPGLYFANLVENGQLQRSIKFVVY